MQITALHILYQDVIRSGLNLRLQLKYGWYTLELFVCLQYYALLALPIKKQSCFSSIVCELVESACYR